MSWQPPPLTSTLLQMPGEPPSTVAFCLQTTVDSAISPFALSIVLQSNGFAVYKIQLLSFSSCPPLKGAFMAHAPPIEVMSGGVLATGIRGPCDALRSGTEVWAVGKALLELKLL